MSLPRAAGEILHEAKLLCEPVLDESDEVSDAAVILASRVLFEHVLHVL